MKKIKIVNLVFQRWQTSQELLLDKIVIQSRLVSLRVIQKDKTRLSEVNTGFFFFFKREDGIFGKYVCTVRVVEFSNWKRWKSKSLNFQSSKLISIKTIFGTSGSISVIVEPSLKSHGSWASALTVSSWPDSLKRVCSKILAVFWNVIMNHVDKQPPTLVYLRHIEFYCFLVKAPTTGLGSIT